MKLAKIFLAIAFGALICIGGNIGKAKADGGIFYYPNFPTAETSQKAFIYYANKTENMVILTSFQGNVGDFVWVVPTPSKPEVTKGNVDLFNTLADISKINYDSGRVYDTSLSLGMTNKSLSGAVQVISKDTVDMYDTVTLKATDENALSKWLTDNGYSFPENQAANMKSYVDDGWYFVAAKISADAIGKSSTSGGMNNGTLTPLRLTFQSDKIIYPMKLTALALNQALANDTKNNLRTYSSNLPISVFVLSDHKAATKQLDISWASWIGKEDIARINSGLGSNIVSGQKLFLTRLSGYLSPSQITDDFTISNAGNDKEYPTPYYEEPSFWLSNLLYLFLIPLAIVFFPVPLGLIFLIFLLLQLFVRKKWLYILGLVFQILYCLVIALAGLEILYQNNYEINLLWPQIGVIGGALGGAAMLGLGIFGLIKMIKRYKGTFEKPLAQ
ncbi:MAG: DUF2330 domain-containing protein [Candidatus Berkelbacteria bacterium]|nr:DUF2330 domain-containing protein [Candidatus Berkelbacteria bacterium]